ncbi:MAG: hypothetical protein Q9168_008202 [Polycauliona sp. 1 TL-2023]
MSTSKPPTSPDPSNAPPPSYIESLTTSQPANPTASRVFNLISTHIQPHLNDAPTTTLILVPFDITPLFASPTSEKSTGGTALAFPGERLVGFNADDHPILIRLSDTDGGLRFWRSAITLRELISQLSSEVSSLGYTLMTKGKISVETGWQSSEQVVLARGEARLHADVREICLRVENDMGLYETRSGMAVIVKVELGFDPENDDLYG